MKQKPKRIYTNGRLWDYQATPKRVDARQQVRKMAEKIDKEMQAYLGEYDSVQQKQMGDRLEIEFDKLYKLEIVSTFEGIAADTKSVYTGYRLSETSPMCPNGVFFLSGVSMKTMNDHLQYTWKDHTQPLKVKLVKQKVLKPGKRDYHIVKPMTVDKW